MLNGLLRIGMKFYSHMSVAIVGDVFGDNLVRLNVSDTLSSECSKVMVP